MTFKTDFLGTKLYIPLDFVYLVWTVAMEELLYGQRSGTIRHGSVQDLHCNKNPPGVRGYLVDGQTQVLEEFSLESVQREPKPSLECLFIHP